LTSLSRSASILIRGLGARIYGISRHASVASKLIQVQPSQHQRFPLERVLFPLCSRGHPETDTAWQLADIISSRLPFSILLAMSATFTTTAPAGTKRRVNEQAESMETELKDVGNRQDMADVTLVPRDVTQAQSKL
jgi:hypothetical protein